MSPEKNELKIFTAIPNGGVLQPQCMESLFRVAAFSRHWASLDVHIVSGYSCEMARNEAVRQFLASDADYLWFVDSDIILPDDVLMRLINAGQMIVSGVYYRKEPSEDPIAEVCRVDGEETVFYRASEIPAGLFTAGAVGFGCVLIHRSVIEAMYPHTGDRMFVYHFDPIISEDLWFCNNASRLGYTINVDGTLILGHIATTIY